MTKLTHQSIVKELKDAGVQRPVTWCDCTQHYGRIIWRHANGKRKACLEIMGNKAFFDGMEYHTNKTKLVAMLTA